MQLLFFLTFFVSIGKFFTQLELSPYFLAWVKNRKLYSFFFHLLSAIGLKHGTVVVPL